MDKQRTHHLELLAKVGKIFQIYGISCDPDDAIHYLPIPRNKGTCHFEVVGLTPFPILIKTAYADSVGNNQTIRYVGQLEQINDEVIFIYDGGGWAYDKHSKILSRIKMRLGSDHVFSLAWFESWLITKLEEKKTY